MENNNELKALTKRVLKQLSDFYNGDLWVTDNLYTKIFSLSSPDAFKKVKEHNHTIAQQVTHIIAWRNFGVQKLNGNDQFDIEDNSFSDWPEPDDWNIIKKEFESCHNNLISAIKNFPDEKWNLTVPGRSYSFLFLINGIVEHDYYHYGQIGSVLATIKKMEE